METTLKVNWPEKDGRYKVVQIYLDGEPDMIFDGLDMFHGISLFNYLLKRGITAETFMDKAGQLAPVLEGEKYKVVGAGNGIVKVEDRSLICHGRSRGYEIGIDATHLEDLAEREIDWDIGEL